MKRLFRCLVLLTVAIAAGPAVGADTTAPKPISLQDCIEMALRNNLDLRIERYNPQLAIYDLSAARGAYDPEARGSAQHANNVQGASLSQQGQLIPSYTSKQNNYVGSIGGLTPLGTTYQFFTDVNPQNGERPYFDTNILSFRNASVESATATVGLKITQPLLKNFLIDGTRLNISVAKLRVKSTEQGLRQKVIDTVTSVETTYYDLIYAREAIGVQREALTLAQRLVSENRKKLEVGSIAPLDLQQAEAQAASAEADLLTAQRNYDIQENALKRLTTDDFATWATQPLQPLGDLAAQRQFFNRQDSWGKGLTMRPDLLQARYEVERTGLQVKYDKNQLLPQLDLIGSYNLSGTSLRTGTTGGSGAALSDLTTRDQPSWAVGGQISFPIGNRSARSRYHAAKAASDQTLIGLKRLEQQILVQIDDAIKQAQSSYDRVIATRKSVEFSQAALDAEQKKLENGKSTSFVVLRLQRDLTSARSDEIRVLAEYQKALAYLAQFEGSTLERRAIDLSLF